MGQPPPSAYPQALTGASAAHTPALSSAQAPCGQRWCPGPTPGGTGRREGLRRPRGGSGARRGWGDRGTPGAYLGQQLGEVLHKDTEAGPAEGQVFRETIYHQKEEKSLAEKDEKNKIYADIKPFDGCPCGSGKIFCECHGSDTRRKHRRRR